MPLEIDIKMAYVEQEVVETAAREPEARIRKIEDAVWLVRQSVCEYKITLLSFEISVDLKFVGAN